MGLVLSGLLLLILTGVIFQGRLREVNVGFLMVEMKIALIISLGL